MKKDTNKTMIQNISDFVSLNSFILLILIAIVAFHQLFIVGGAISSLKSNQIEMMNYLKENVSKVYFLSASGQVISSERSTLSYADERFKEYIASNILNTFIGGLVKVSSNLEVSYEKPSDFIKKNKDIKNFYTSFIAPDYTVIESTLRSLHRNILDNKHPEYIDIVSEKFIKYSVSKSLIANKSVTNIYGVIEIEVIKKSYIVEFKKWNAKKEMIRIPFEIRVDVGKYGRLDNPFGIHFTHISIPVLRKPTASQLRDEAL